VTLTPAGEQVLVRARELLVLHDQMVRELQGFTDRIVVDVVGHGLTPETVLSAARRGGPDVEYSAEFQGGLELALPLLQARRLDVTFGRLAGVTAATDGAFAERLIRLERIAVLLPKKHCLATLRAVPLAAALLRWRIPTVRWLRMLVACSVRGRGPAHRVRCERDHAVAGRR
jgi:DNA-binding transcriptional LysR family regulator